MCLPGFVEFRQIGESSPFIGYRAWKNKLENSLVLISENQDYLWKKIEGPHEIRETNSGIYAYNYNSYNYNNYYDNYYNNNNYRYYDNNNYSNYRISGIITQWGKVAIHKIGQRSEFAKVNTIFKIREQDAKGPKKFLDWIKLFNRRIISITDKYDAKTISWQDFTESKTFNAQS